MPPGVSKEWARSGGRAWTVEEMRMVQEDLVVVVGGGIIFLGRDVVFWLFCVFVQSCPAMGVNCSTVGGPLCEAAVRPHGTISTKVYTVNQQQ